MIEVFPSPAPSLTFADFTAFSSLAMTADIVFLHTADVHVPTFSQLLAEADPSLHATHVVRADLLALAQAIGADDLEVVRQVRQAMADAAASGPALVVCTCSTIGGVAERTPTEGRFGAMRIDRAMADHAVMQGPRILVVATSQSTLAPTTQLIAESAAALGRQAEVLPLWVQGAWAHFERGDRAAYVAAVAEAVRGAADQADVVVLAQASMAPAQQSLQDLGVPVLASPALGVAAIVERLRS